jgi:4'-phosphopantetheinyl transferase
MSISWQAIPPHPSLSPQTLELWCIHIPDWHAVQQELYLLLSTDEQARANRFKFERHQKAFSITRGVLRLILGQYLGIKPQRLTFGYTKHGKPQIAEPFDQRGLQFNLSHSHEMAVYAIAQDHAIGVDVEHIRPVPDVDHLVKRFFSPQEAATFRQIPDSCKPRAFFRGWTQKEAYLKAIGTGLSISLDQVEVTLSPHEPVGLLRLGGTIDDDCQKWRMLDFEPAAGYAGALAIRPRSHEEAISVIGYHLSADRFRAAIA